MKDWLERHEIDLTEWLVNAFSYAMCAGAIIYLVLTIRSAHP